MFYFLLYLIAFLYRAVWDGHNRVLTKLSAGLGHLHRSPWFTDIHKWKWRDIRPSMVTHTRNSCSAFTHPKCTHTVVNTHPEQLAFSGARGRVGGSVPCSRASQSWYWRRRERCTFTPPTYNSCRTWDSNSQPLDYESNSLTIRPRLPKYREGW